MLVCGPCIDLFCGAGGLSYGFMEAGFEIGAGVDIDTAALVTFQNNHPYAVPIRADVTELTGEKLRKMVGGSAILGLLGGPPCQGYPEKALIPKFHDWKMKSRIKPAFVIKRSGKTSG